jgi:hypothetical protein
MENRIITDDIAKSLEKEIRDGAVLEIRLRTNKDNTEELVVYKKTSQKLNIARPS